MSARPEKPFTKYESCIRKKIRVISTEDSTQYSWDRSLELKGECIIINVKKSYAFLTFIPQGSNIRTNIRLFTEISDEDKNRACCPRSGGEDTLQARYSPIGG